MFVLICICILFQFSIQTTEFQSTKETTFGKVVLKEENGMKVVEYFFYALPKCMHIDGIPYTSALCAAGWSNTLLCILHTHTPHREHSSQRRRSLKAYTKHRSDYLYAQSLLQVLNIFTQLGYQVNWAMGKGEGWGEGQGQGCGQGAGGDDWQNTLCSCCSGDCGNCKYQNEIPLPPHSPTHRNLAI